MSYNMYSVLWIVYHEYRLLKVWMYIRLLHILNMDILYHK